MASGHVHIYMYDMLLNFLHVHVYTNIRSSLCFFFSTVTSTPGRSGGEQVLVQGNAVKAVARVLQSMYVHVYVCSIHVYKSVLAH